MQPDALGSFPYLVVLGFGIVWMTLSTLGFVWFATWRSTRREAALSAVPTAAPRPGGFTRGRVLRLMGAGLVVGVLVGGGASACALYLAAQRTPPRGLGSTQPAP